MYLVYESQYQFLKDTFVLDYLHITCHIFSQLNFLLKTLEVVKK